MQWRGIGPYRGGRALAVAGIPGDPTTFYFGAVAGGVWKTTDGGATWLPLTDQTSISSVGAIAVVGDTDRVFPRGPARGLSTAVVEAARGVSRELGAPRWPFAG